MIRERKIYESTLEPRDKSVLWLRPFLDKEGYILLYYSSTGWVPLIDSRPWMVHDKSAEVLELRDKEVIQNHSSNCPDNCD